MPRRGFNFYSHFVRLWLVQNIKTKIHGHTKITNQKVFKEFSLILVRQQNQIRFIKKLYHSVFVHFCKPSQNFTTHIETRHKTVISFIHSQEEAIKPMAGCMGFGYGFVYVFDVCGSCFVAFVR